jgi:adenine-specific DNA-methyltransferase
MWFPVTAPDGNEVYPIHDDGREARWALGKAAVFELQRKNEIIWKNRGTDLSPNWIPYTREFASDNPSRPFPTLWTDLPTTRQTKAHQKELFGIGNEFDTPKPEALIERILQLGTNPGDLVLDSFAGSGTAGATAHKMNRRWIMVELGQHCETHIIPRLKKVINGEDNGGISEAVEWKGGGGFRYFRLASSLLEKDHFGNWVIAKSYNPAMLTEAMCKLMGFTYAPSQEPAEYWRHGHSTEKDFIYVTTQSLTHDALKKLSEEVGPERTLLICCKAFSAREAAFLNLTLKKIPQAVLTKCEWGRDDYSLRVANLPPVPEEEQTARVETLPKGNKAAARARAVADLFAAGEGS